MQEDLFQKSVDGWVRDLISDDTCDRLRLDLRSIATAILEIQIKGMGNISFTVMMVEYVPTNLRLSAIRRRSLKHQNITGTLTS